MPRKGKRTQDVLRPGSGGPEHAPARRPWNLGNLPRPRMVVDAHPPPPGMPATDWPTLREVVAYRLWRLTQPGVSETTEKVQRSALCYALAELPARPVPGDIQAWHRAMVEQLGQEPPSADRQLAYLSTAYECARAFGGPIANPCKLVAQFGEGPPAGRALGGPEEAAEIYERARVVCDEREKVALALLRFCAIRRGELLALLPSDVDVRANVLRIERQRSGASRSTEARPTKTRSAVRKVPLEILPERERAELIELANKGGGTYREQNQFGPERQSVYLFPWSSETIRNGLLRNLRAVAPARFPAGRAIHQWRHVGLETVDEATNDEREVQRLAGHASRRSTERYLRGRTGQRMTAGTADRVRQLALTYAPERILRAVAPRSRARALLTQAEARGSHDAAAAAPRGVRRAQDRKPKLGAPPRE